MVRVLADDGRELATATRAKRLNPTTVLIERVDGGKGMLLQYYFGQGRRMIMLDLGGTLQPARLRTRWLGAAREWIANLEPAAEGSGQPAA
jgi:hypothetical protein